MKIAFVTFGCRLNRAESLDLEARYRAAGHEIIDLASVPKTSGSVPDLILVRGCSVTAKAQRDCEKAIAHLRTQFPTAEVRPIGCLPNAGPVPQKNMGKIQGTGPKNLGSVPMQTSRAYLKIQDGCNGKCSFCIVPYFRGTPVSVPFREIMARTKAFLAAGYREIVLTGCNLSLYHSGNHNLASLLAALAELGSVPQTGGPRSCAATNLGGPRSCAAGNSEGPRSCAADSCPQTGGPRSCAAVRIRIGSLEPGPWCDDILDVMAEHPNICRFLHLSLQSGSNRVLKRMNRPYEITWAERFCTVARERLGTDLALGADIITGFPGETEEDFEATRAFLERHAFSNLHVFPYSERPGTPAATMDGALPRAVRLARARELTALGHRQRETFAQTFLGREVEVCVERGGEHGWTSAYLPCKWKGPAERRSLVRKRVIAINGDTLLA